MLESNNAGLGRRASSPLSSPKRPNLRQTTLSGSPAPPDFRSPTGKRRVVRRKKTTRIPKGQTLITSFFQRQHCQPEPDNFATRVDNDEQLDYEDMLRIRQVLVNLPPLPSSPPRMDDLVKIGKPDIVALPAGGCLDKLTVFLDLDETLVHTDIYQPGVAMTPKVQGIKYHDISLRCGYHTFKLRVAVRPGTPEFLEKMSERFHLVLFTASTKEYADAVMQKIDPTNTLVPHRLHRTHCTKIHQSLYLKDVRILGRDERRVVLVDNSLEACGYALDNSLPIITWHSDEKDESLEALANTLYDIEYCYDVRVELKRMFDMRNKLLNDDSVPMEQEVISIA
ncbi:hypothetical protein P9112_006778 [Eukaryota sp. TZLM1-RC]